VCAACTTIAFASPLRNSQPTVADAVAAPLSSVVKSSQISF
jgi:hypothetical protein